MYLYTVCKDDFSTVPDELIKVFGRPEFSMMLNLERRSRLARADIEKVKLQLLDVGYYLQMPPTLSKDKNSLPANDIK